MDDFTHKMIRDVIEQTEQRTVYETRLSVIDRYIREQARTGANSADIRTLAVMLGIGLEYREEQE